MIILDTNIISELIKNEPDESVLRWFDKQEKSAFLTSITIGEMQRGIMNLPEGKRKQNLLVALDIVLKEYDGNILDYTTKMALAFGTLCSKLKSEGVGIGQGDAMIAAITIVYGATLVTRNEKDFMHCGIPILNPFQD